MKNNKAFKRKKVIYSGILFIAIIMIVLITNYYLMQNPINSPSISISNALSNDNIKGYDLADVPRQIQFPKDHGPHNGFKTEWWYLTGHLDSDDANKHFGFQLTIFRNALSNNKKLRTSQWATNQLYMAHFTLTDVANKHFYYFDRLSRGIKQLAGAQSKPFKVWLENWFLTGQGKNQSIFPLRVYTQEKDISLDLILNPLKAPVFHGDNGLSKKGPNKGNASYYYSYSRLQASGRISIKQNQFRVKGLAWMDREWFTNALGKNQKGWDWFSLQLVDGREIMCFQIREKNGGLSKFSSGVIIHQDGSLTKLTLTDFNIKVLAQWQSPRGGSYPAQWHLTIPKEKITLKIEPYLADQELNLLTRYWEGAVKLKGSSGDKEIEGNGYVELTGYANKKN